MSAYKDILDDCLNIIFSKSENRVLTDEKGKRYIREDVVLRAIKIALDDMEYYHQIKKEMKQDGDKRNKGKETTS